MSIGRASAGAQTTIRFIHLTSGIRRAYAEPGAPGTAAQARISLVTRPGCFWAAESAYPPPPEIATSVARSWPRWSSRATKSSFQRWKPRPGTGSVSP